MVRRHVAAFFLMRALLPFAALALLGCSHPRAPEPAAPRPEASANTAVQRVLEGRRPATKPVMKPARMLGVEVALLAGLGYDYVLT